MAKVRVLVADEQALFREGVCALLEMCEDIEIVGEAANGKETVEKVRDQTPDVVLIDIAIPIVDGNEVTYRIHKENSDTKVLLLTQYEDKDTVIRGLKAGANGFIPRKVAASDLVSAIIAVYRGGCFLYPTLAKIVVDDYVQHLRRAGVHDTYDQLTFREKQVLKLIAEGRKSGEIAELLDITARTALEHSTKIMKKLGIHNRTELIKYAIRKHVVNLND